MILDEEKWSRMVHDIFVGHDRLTVSSLLRNQGSSIDDVETEKWSKREQKKE